MTEHYTNLIGGEWTSSTSADMITVRDSTDESELGTVVAGTADDVDRAVRAARRAFPQWSATAPADRSRLLERLADAIEQHADEFSDLITRETGSTTFVSRSVQVGAPIAFTRVAAEVAESFDYEERIGHTLVVKEPLGVVGCIGPWNYPLNQIVKKAMFAIAAGSTTVVKPSEIAPLDVARLGNLAIEVGFPPGVLNIVNGHGSVVGAAISAHPDIDMVSFTGSTQAGKRVAAAAAGNVKKVALELGGKSALIVLDDLSDEEFADAVAGGVSALFINSGQTCAALTRLLVPRSRLAEAEEIARATVEGAIVGDPFDEATHVGPVASGEHRDRIQEYIRLGIDGGAEVLAGGPDAPDGLDRGYFVRPTVFSKVTNDMAIAQQEIFGPVQTIIPFDDVDHAVQIANDSPYGLSGGVTSGDFDRALQVARRIRTGSVRVNGASANIRAPFGGYKQSGIGREYGRYGFEEFLETKSIHCPPLARGE